MLFEHMTLKDAEQFYEKIKNSNLDAKVKSIMLDDIIFYTDHFERAYGTPACEVKYYIEISDAENPSEYALQSKWYDTEKEALEFLKLVDFVGEQYDIAVMYAEWDEEADCPKDIDVYSIISKNMIGGGLL